MKCFNLPKYARVLATHVNFKDYIKILFQLAVKSLLRPQSGSPQLHLYTHCSAATCDQ